MAAVDPRILAQSARRPSPPVTGRWSGWHALAVAVLGLSGVAAYGLAPDTTLEVIPVRTILRDLPNPVGALPHAAAAAPADPLYWREERIRRGDTIGSVFARMGVDDPEAMAWLRADPGARALYQLRPGRPLRVQTDAAGRLASLRFLTAGGDMLANDRRDDRFVAAARPAPVEVRWEMAAGTIESSLFSAADEAGLPDSVTLQLADVFAGDVDFLRDLRRGDRFSVVYEVRYVDGEAVGAGRIVAAEFVNRGIETRAYLWRDAAGAEAYYAEDGAARRKAFLRSPMEFSRISSGFSLARLHPIMQTWRAHKGVDYSAPVGTPVHVTGNGKIIYAGVQNGYGNVIQVQHQGVYTTLYAHLSRIAPQVRPGARVAQGEVIGYVGQTGWATGPHLHYEFHVGYEQRDPVTLALPNGEPLSPADRRVFAERIVPMNNQLMLARSYGGSPLAFAE